MPTYYIPPEGGGDPPSKDAIPVHRCTVWTPRGETQYIDTPASHRIKGLRGYCKYCYATHRNWWQMPAPDAGLILCGRCGYTHLKQLVEEQ